MARPTKVARTKHGSGSPVVSVHSIVSLSEAEHVRQRPGMYLGNVVRYPRLELLPGVETVSRLVPGLSDGGSPLVSLEGADLELSSRTVEVSDAAVQVFNEILSNAVDHAIRCGGSVRSIRVDVGGLPEDIAPDGCSWPLEISKDPGWISVWNDGPSISIEEGQADTAFSRMRAGSNFDDSVGRKVGGMNGVGATVTNVFSKAFLVSCASGSSRLCLSYVGGPETVKKELLPNPSGSSHTHVCFLPDYAALGCGSGLLDSDHASMMVRLVVFASSVACRSLGVSVSLNGLSVPSGDMSFIRGMFSGSSGEPGIPLDYSSDGFSLRALVVPRSGSEPVQASWVNGVWTRYGGRHVEAVLRVVAKAIQTRGSVAPPLKHVSKAVDMIVVAQVDNPLFDSQTKTRLTTDITIKDAPRAFVSAVKASAIRDYVSRMVESVAQKAVAKINTDVSFKNPGIVDARMAGNPRRKGRCLLILTEGDSAKSMAVSGLDVIGSDLHGVFPLRGKPLNSRGVSVADVLKNAELGSLSSVLGAGSGGRPRYDGVVIMADQDSDGIHITALVLNFLDCVYPKLLRGGHGFEVFRIDTPLIRVKLPSGKVLEFSDSPSHEEWEAENPDLSSKSSTSYYKGLGSHDKKQTRDIFMSFKSRLARFDTSVESLETSDIVKRVLDDATAESLDLAFSKERTADRKKWMTNRMELGSSRNPPGGTTVESFVNGPLADFAVESSKRALPCSVDGLKPTQRKILYTILHLSKDKHHKVADLAGCVSRECQYHHGEVSMTDAIVRMAQSFVGSNNLPLLMEHGQFGTRLSLGRDAASPRYIHTSLHPIARKIFRREDDAVLTHNFVDGSRCEPIRFAPVLPMVLVNGASGIAQGCSTEVPQHDPLDVCRAIRSALAGGKDEVLLVPWFKGFGGTIEENGGKFIAKGSIRRVSNNQVIIDEIPPRESIEKYKAFLGTMLKSGSLTKIDCNYKAKMTFVVHLSEELASQSDSELFKSLRLTQVVSTGNMNMYDSARNTIVNHKTAWSVVLSFVRDRLPVYSVRKERLESDLTEDILRLEASARFVGAVVSGEVSLVDTPQPKMIDILVERGIARDVDEAKRLLSGRVDGFCLDKVELDRKRAEDQRVRLQTVRDKTPESMWLEDLSELEVALRNIPTDV